MIKVFNKEKLLNIYKDFPIEIIEKIPSINDVNIIFVNQKYIKDLNLEYRKKDEVTDVLSFDMDSEQLLGEVYVCPEYIKENISEESFVEEIVRVCIHGVLHIQGFEHEKDFDEFDYKEEAMYIKQEEILNNLLNKK